MMPEDERYGIVDMDDDCVIEPQDYTGDYPLESDDDEEDDDE